MTGVSHLGAVGHGTGVSHLGAVGHGTGVSHLGEVGHVTVVPHLMSLNMKEMSFKTFGDNDSKEHLRMFL